MVKPIVRDVIFLAQRSTDAGSDDLQTARDLLDTLIAHKDGCVGMAANMIGVNKRIIAFLDGMKYTVMLNPEIIKSAESYETEEGCLSLDGIRKTKRFKRIKVRYMTENLEVRIKTYTGYTAQIIQHELDHCAGILI